VNQKFSALAGLGGVSGLHQVLHCGAEALDGSKNLIGGGPAPTNGSACHGLCL
jgi:hypothetical protein